MKKYYLLSVFVFLFLFSTYAQKNDELDGKWNFVSFNGETSNLTFEDFSDCYWCQLDEADKSFEFQGNHLLALMNGDRFLFDVEVVGKTIKFSIPQTVEITHDNEETFSKEVIGSSEYSITIKKKKIILSDVNKGIRNQYIFEKAK